MENKFLTSYFKISVTSRHALHTHTRGTQGCSQKKISEGGIINFRTQEGYYEVQGLGNHELRGEDMHTGDTAHTLAKYKIFSVPSSAQFKYKKFQRKYFTLKNFLGAQAHIKHKQNIKLFRASSA